MLAWPMLGTGGFFFGQHSGDGGQCSGDLLGTSFHFSGEANLWTIISKAHAESAHARSGVRPRHEAGAEDVA